MRRLALAAVLVVAWLLLWDSPTLGQLIAGSAVAATLLFLLPTGESRSRLAIPVRPVATVRLVVWFTWQFLISNYQVAHAAIFPKRVRVGVVRVELRTTSATLAALVSNITALTPGLQPVDSSSDPPSIDVHVLTLTSEPELRALVHRLEELVLAAFGEDAPTRNDPNDQGGLR
jgi:multicomponent Na+:H+ antiporter subunit E